jgi:putative DNA methylase
MRTEMAARQVAVGANALASSVVLVCRPLAPEANVIPRREFIGALKRELPQALATLQQGNIAPVDLPQSTVGPGMAIFSRYKAVLEADGKPMRVRQALQLINQVLDEFLSKTEGDMDADTRAAVTWFEQNEFKTGKSGDLDSVARARNTTIEGLQKAGIFEAKAGKARLIPRGEMSEDWDPMQDDRLTIWECTQHLIRAFQEKGEAGAGALLAKIRARSISDDAPRALAYRLYTTCERRGWAQEARAYNELVASWPHIQESAMRSGDEKRGLDLFGGDEEEKA